MQENETLSVIDSLYATFLRGDLNAVLDCLSVPPRAGVVIDTSSRINPN
jgi:hypothetical protein